MECELRSEGGPEPVVVRSDARAGPRRESARLDRCFRQREREPQARGTRAAEKTGTKLGARVAAVIVAVSFCSRNAERGQTGSGSPLCQPSAHGRDLGGLDRV